MDRREFLTKASLALALVGVPVTITSCGSDSPTEPSNNGGSNDVTGSATGSGHPHTGVITGAQLSAGVGVTITFTGSGHVHDLPLTDSEVQMIAQGATVQRVNFTDTKSPDHAHTYTFN